MNSGPARSKSTSSPQLKATNPRSVLTNNSKPGPGSTRRRSALTLLGRTLDRLRREFEEAGQAATFAELSAVLTDGASAVLYATLAGRLGTTEGAVRVAVHRLRRRYNALLRAEIAATVDEPAEVDEIRALFTALGK